MSSVWEREMEKQPDIEPIWLEGPAFEAQQEEVVEADVVTLLNLGKLTHEIDVRGHKVVLRTLRMTEELEIGLLIKPFIGTLEEGRALATAIVAASIESFDGNSLVTEIGPDEDLLRKKFDYVRTKFYWPVIKLIYEDGWIPLIEKQGQAIEEFRKK